MVTLLEKTSEKALPTDSVPQGNTEFEQSFGRVFHLMTTAFTPAEVEVALTAAHEHEARFKTQGSEFAHGFHHTIEAAKQRECEAQNMGLSLDQIDERNNLLRSLIWFGSPDDAYDIVRLTDLQRRLEAWLSRFPNDSSAAHALESVKGDLDVATILKPA